MDENEIFAFLNSRLNTSPRATAERNGYEVVNNTLVPGKQPSVSPWEENGKPFLLDVMDELFPEDDSSLVD